MEVWIGSLSGILLLVLFAGELARGFYSRRRMPWGEKWINGLGWAQNLLVVEPAVAFLAAALWGLLAPAQAGAWAGAPFWLAVAGLLLVHDFAQYWFHRWAHHNPWLWRVHRAHHSAHELSVAVAPRLNFFWLFLSPMGYIWGASIHLGLAPVAGVAFAIKAVTGFLGHSGLRWDLPLYRVRWLRPLVWLVEHVFTTPDAHHAHHGLGANAQPMGNYAPILILWDFVFGTAHLPHARQERFGVDDGPDGSWAEQLYWPVMGRARFARASVAAVSILALVGILVGCARSVEPAAEPVDWQEASQRYVIRLATQDPDGEVRTPLLWLVTLDDHGYLRTSDTRWLRNLQRDPEASLQAGGLGHPVHATLVLDEEEHARVMDAFSEKYGLQSRMVLGFYTWIGRISGPEDARILRLRALEPE